MNKLKKWLIMQLAGDTLVILNAVVLYKYYPVFLNNTKDHIVENNGFIKIDVPTAFNIYDASIFEANNGDLDIKEEHKSMYSKMVADINKNNIEKPEAPKGRDITGGKQPSK